MAVLWLGFGALVASVAQPGTVAAPDVEHRSWAGALHVHTSRSDGVGTVEEVARAARDTGLDFVLITDHNLERPVPPRYVEGVLVIDAVERSTDAGHRVEMAGFAIAAHPLNRRRPYAAVRSEALAGIEVLSAEDLWRDALASPVSRLAPSVLAYPFSTRAALLHLVRWPDATMRLWMELAATRPVVGSCSTDAHGWPAYAAVFGLLRAHLPAPATTSRDAVADASHVAAAIGSGYVWCSLDALANGSAFSFTAEDGTSGLVASMGSSAVVGAGTRLVADLHLRPAPRGAAVILYRGTDAVARVDGTRLEYAPSAAGVYRVEAEVAGRTLLGATAPMRFLYSNPIYLRTQSIP